MIKRTNSSLLAKYLGIYQKDPNSRAFAPLAESYRKLGMLDEAFQVLKNGIAKHPTYTLGYLVLSKCYFDKDDYDSCYKVLRPIIGDNQDNLAMLKLFGNCCIKIGHLEEALEIFKILLLSNPRDVEAAEKVKFLEEDLEANLKRNHVPKYESEFTSDEDDWVHVSFSEKEKNPTLKLLEEKKEEDPVLTLTLVDLYLAQGHLEKAKEILGKFEELHPKNKQIELKKIQLNELVAARSESIDSPQSEEESHHRLLQLVESKTKNFKNQDDKLHLVKDKFDKFLFLIRQRSATSV